MQTASWVMNSTAILGVLEMSHCGGFSEGPLNGKATGSGTAATTREQLPGLRCVDSKTLSSLVVKQKMKLQKLFLWLFK